HAVEPARAARPAALGGDPPRPRPRRPRGDRRRARGRGRVEGDDGGSARRDDDVRLAEARHRPSQRGAPGAGRLDGRARGRRDPADAKQHELPIPAPARRVPGRELHEGAELVRAGRAPVMSAAMSLTSVFEAQAERVGATTHRTTPAAMVSRALEVLREGGCRTVALADVLPRRDAFADALHAAGLAVLPGSSLRPTHRADAGISIATLAVAETGSTLLHS